MPRRALHVALGVMLLAGTAQVAEWRRASAGFAPFAPQRLPNSAGGDFDGDGRPDIALIQEGVGVSRISITLSGTSNTTYLEARVASLITTDIDRDGDLDLIAAVPSGQVVTWLNDGRGHFTAHETSPSNRFSSETTIGQTRQDEAFAVSAGGPLMMPGPGNGVAVGVTRIRPPTARPSFEVHPWSLPTLRGPPLSTRLS